MSKSSGKILKKVFLLNYSYLFWGYFLLGHSVELFSAKWPGFSAGPKAFALFAKWLIRHWHWPTENHMLRVQWSDLLHQASLQTVISRRQVQQLLLSIVQLVIAVTCDVGFCGVTATLACDHSSASGPLSEVDLQPKSQTEYQLITAVAEDPLPIEDLMRCCDYNQPLPWLRRIRRRTWQQ